MIVCWQKQCPEALRHQLTKARTSSSTAAAIMSCPIGVLSTCPDLSTLTAMPVEVGARQKPVAMADRRFAPMMVEMVKPMMMGVHEPRHAVMMPLHRQVRYVESVSIATDIL